ncbi:MAG: rhomboid family intramembrane serine protease [Planctomycetota bacterium]
MFLPVGDAPNPRETPWVTYGLIALNVAVFLLLWPTTRERPRPHDPRVARYYRTLVEVYGEPTAQAAVRDLSEYDLLVFEHGFKPRDPELRDLFSSLFLHGGLLHLVGNLLFLWIFGNNVEVRAGPGLYLFGYLATGALAGLGDACLRWGSPLPAVGASGAISGVLGAYYLLFPGNVVRVAVFLFPFLLDVWELRARVVLGFYVIVQNLLPALITTGEGGVSYGAHLGGFVAGVAGAWLLRGAAPGPGDAVDLSALAPLEVARRADALAHPLDAVRLWQRYLQAAGPAREGDALLGLGYALARAGRPIEAYQHAYAAWTRATRHASRERAAALMRALQAQVQVPRRYVR